MRIALSPICPIDLPFMLKYSIFSCIVILIIKQLKPKEHEKINLKSYAKNRMPFSGPRYDGLW